MSEGRGRLRRAAGWGGVAPVWWPATIAALILLAGLIALAATPGTASEPVLIYAVDERPSPIPRDPDGDRLVDLNRASRQELEALPGIGAVRAEALMTARVVAPFTSLAEIGERGIVPLSVLADLATLAGVWPLDRPEAAIPEVDQ